MRHIGFYNSGDAVQTAIDNKELGKPYVVYLNDEHRLDWNSASPSVPVYSAMPLTFRIISAGTIVFTQYKRPDGEQIEYSLNGEPWTTITSDPTSTIQVDNGDIVQFKGENATYGDEAGNSNFGSSTAVFEAYGNIMSLIYGDNFTSQYTISTSYTFSNLFRSCVGLVSAEHLILPSTSVYQGSYQFMFFGCSNLVTAPEILVATVLDTDCYLQMFNNCVSLTKSPVLPADNIAHYAYFYMFLNCSSLSHITCLATLNIAANDSTTEWVAGVAQTGTFVKHPDAVWPTGDNGIPSGWTVEDADI